MKRGSVLNRWMDRYAGIPALLFTSPFRRRGRLPGEVRRLGVTASPTLGDTLLTSAALGDLRRAFPQARILFFCSSGSRAAAELLPEVDELVSISMTDPLLTVRAFRAQRLDLLVDFTPWQRITAFFAAASGARFRVGFRAAGQHRHWHYDRVAEHSRGCHEVENFRSLVRAIGVDATSEPRLRTPWLGARGESEIVVFHPWASGDRSTVREWPEACWVDLARRLGTPPGTRFVVTGAPSQLAKSEAFCRALRDGGVRAEPFAGAAGLRPLTELLHSAALVVSVNTGIMHLAAVLGAPTVAINGPTASHRWGPRGPRVRSVDTPGGRGGYLHLGLEFRGQPVDPMSSTPVKDVYAACVQLAPQLAAVPAGPPPREQPLS